MRIKNLKIRNSVEYIWNEEEKNARVWVENEWNSIEIILYNDNSNGQRRKR